MAEFVCRLSAKIRHPDGLRTLTEAFRDYSTNTSSRRLLIIGNMAMTSRIKATAITKASTSGAGPKSRFTSQ